MRGLTRREFMKGVGAFGVLSVTGGFSLTSSMACRIEKKEAYGPSSFIGVGEVGCRLGHSIAGHLERARLIDLDQDPIDHLVFLAGQTADATFWLARDRVLSQDPYLMFTFVEGQFPHQPHANEGVIRMQANELSKVSQLLLHLNSVATIPGIIGLDISDLYMVCSGGFLNACQLSSKRQLKQTLQQSRMGFSPGLLVILCYPDPDAMKMQDLDILDDALEGNTDRETYVTLGVDWCTQSDSELVLVSRSLPIA